MDFEFFYIQNSKEYFNEKDSIRKKSLVNPDGFEVITIDLKDISDIHMKF